jgi:hypothetical protein
VTTETRFHRHWHVTVRKQGRIYRWLRKPRLRTCDREYVERSRLVWGVHEYPHGTIYVLTILGILHGLTGLTLVWQDENEHGYLRGNSEPA